MSDREIQPDPWAAMRAHTAARIALGRSGGSLPTRAQLDFRLAHARARDAVLSAFDAEALADRLRVFGHPVLVVCSAAQHRAEFLQRPDLGRSLSADSRAALTAQAANTARCDLAIIVSDGLSTLAAVTQAEPVLAALLPLLTADGWSIAPLIVALHARVALQDEIGEILRAQLSLMLLGERPGLGSADSLGAYFTFSPAPGRTDADRNCISNIRPGGLAPAEAARKLHALLTQSRQLQLSGVALKDETAPQITSDTSFSGELFNQE
jgi:ethanolamine ammonia-lyase small subunit